MRRWDRLVDGYLEECRTRGLASGTIDKVCGELDRCGRWLKRRRPRPALEAVDAELIVKYVEARGWFRAKVTVYGMVSVLRGMGEYLVREGVWRSNPLRWMKGPKVRAYQRLPRRIDAQHLQALWKGAAQTRAEYRRQQWLALLGLLYGTGLRRGELERMDVDDWDRAAGTVRIDGRKTGRERSVPVPAVVRDCLEAYLPQRHNHLERLGCVEQRALFVDRRGGRLSGNAISRGMHTLARRSGVPLCTLHQFRHSCASDLLEAGVRLPEVQKILGHQAIASTVRYLEIADPQRHAAMARHPLNGWLQEAA